MIDVEDVHLAFGDTPVLSGASLTVEPGELVGLVGPNGAGKTTLLQTVNGLLDPDDGEVRLDGTPVTDLGSKATSRRVATVPQDTHVNFAFSAEQLVEMGRTPHRSRLDWRDDADPVDRAMERTETTHLRERTVDDLSGGERQRVLLARALAQDAPALVLDEPTANLDINHQVGVLELVRGLVAEDRAVLAAIHDLDLAARYCDRLALLADGQIAVAGDPATVLVDDRLETAFGTARVVSHNPVTGAPRVDATGQTDESTEDRDLGVHVLGSGPRAAEAIGACWRAGYEPSLGIVPEGDAAATVADDLGVEAVTSPPFESPGQEVVASAAALIREAAVVVIADAPVPEALSDAVGSHETVIDARPEADGREPLDVDSAILDARADEGDPSAAAPAVATAVSRLADNRPPADD